jgi:hypothetical protein
VNEPAWLAPWLAWAGERKVVLLAAGGAALVLLVGGLWWANTRPDPSPSHGTAALAVARASADAGAPSALPPSLAAPVVAPAAAPAAAAPAVAGGAALAAAAGAGQGADAGAPSDTVKVVFRTFPPRRALVMWGSKRLGFIDRNAPLVVERPRDSGPLDVVIRADRYLPVHTRAYTFKDTAIDVRITPIEKKDTIYGYKEPLPPDAGAPFPSDMAE